MSHLPNLTEKETLYSVAPGKSVSINKAVKIISGGICGIDLTADELGIVDINNQTLPFIKCIIPLTATKTFVVYYDGTNVYAVIYNIIDGILSIETSLLLGANLTYAVGVALTETKVCLSCVFSGDTNNANLYILNVDTGDIITIADTELNPSTCLTINKVSFSKVILQDLSGLMRIADIDSNDVITLSDCITDMLGVVCVLSSTKFVFLKGSAYYSMYTAQSYTISGFSITATGSILSFPYLLSCQNIASVSTTRIAIMANIALTGSGQPSDRRTAIYLVDVTTSPILLSSFIVYQSQTSDYRVFSKNSNTLLIQRTLQNPALMQIVKIASLDNSMSLSDEISITELSGITSRFIEKVNEKLFIEVTRLSDGKSSIKLVRTVQGIPENIIGFAKNNGTAGEIVAIKCGLEIEGFTNLFLGNHTYIKDTGEISNTMETIPNKIGIAITENKIKFFRTKT